MAQSIKLRKQTKLSVDFYLLNYVNFGADIGTNTICLQLLLVHCLELSNYLPVSIN